MRAFRATYAYNYVQNGWLGDVFHITDNDYFLQSIGFAIPAWGRERGLQLMDCNQHCSYTFLAGRGHACSHVSAIAYTIIVAWEHGLAGQSCTDVPVTWGKGTATNNNQEKVINIDFCRPSKSSKPVTEVNNNASHPVAHMHFKKLETHNDLTTFVASSNIADLWNCPNTMLNRIVTAKREPDSVCQSEHTHSSHDLKLHRWYSIHQL